MAFAGNETNIPKMFENFLYPRGWQEIKITGDLLQNVYRGTIGGDFFKAPFEERSIKEGETDLYIDFVKGNVDFDLEKKRRASDFGNRDSESCIAR